MASEEGNQVPTRDPVTGAIRVHTFLLLLLVNLVLFVAGIASTFGGIGRVIGVAGLAVALVAIGIFTFLMLFFDAADIRSAITATFVLVYFSLMGASLNDTVSDKLSAGFGERIFDSFDTLLGVIIGFYFGGKAVELAARYLRG
ncbi:MAG: hypothetical protein K0R20_2783 [Actinomycetia bacterium]|nr:hypothetical protein [Actinomycetes bacterium]